MSLTQQQRDALPAGHFAVPGKRELPIHDETHTRLAWTQVDHTHGLSEAERAEARRRIKRRAKELGIDTSDWDKALEHAARLTLTAMSLALPEVADHPNRMPFTGILTRIDAKSDKPVGGAGGKKTFLSREVAEAILPSLLGMPIDFTKDFANHDVKQKIGTITAATIEGDAIAIEGFFFAADFPEECERIRAEKDQLGFSYEIQARTLPMGSDALKIVGGNFTGAAVLYKRDAAYESTSLAAKAAKEQETMDLEKLMAMIAALTGKVDGVVTDINALKASTSQHALQANKEMREKIAPHATALRNCAAAMEAAGIGLHSEHGHVRMLHHMAAHMEASAARGEVPYIYRDHDWTFRHAADTRQQQEAKLEDNPAIKKLTETLAGITTQLTDLKAAAFKTVEPPQRKTVSAESLQLLAKGGITEAPKEPLSEHQVDKMLKAAGVESVQARIAAKIQLAQEGLMVRSR